MPRIDNIKAKFRLLDEGWTMNVTKVDDVWTIIQMIISLPFMLSTDGNGCRYTYENFRKR